MTLKDFTKNLRVRVQNIAEKTFIQQIEKIHKNLQNIRIRVRAEVKKYIIANRHKTIEGSKIPDMTKSKPYHTGNMLNKILNDYLTIPKVSYAKTNTRITATIKVPFGIDDDGAGNPLVFSKRNASYARILNLGSKHTREYAGFIDVLKGKYRHSFLQEMEKEVSQKFGKNYKI